DAMSTGTYARWVRSVLAVNPVLLVFIAIYVSIVALSFAAVWTLDSRLPVQAGNLTSYWLESEVIVIAMYLAWVALPRPHRMRYALETVLPIGLCIYGVDAAALTATLWFNLDAKTFQVPFGSLTGIGLILGGGFAGSFLGRYLGGLAATNRLRREAPSSRRSAWFAETSPDGSWRRATGITTGLIMFALILLAQATSLAYAPGSPLPIQLLAAGAWAFTIVVGDHATISITDAAVRVRTRLQSNMGWSVSLSEIESTRAIAARPEPLNFDRSRCVLRTGPALEIRTVTGGRYTVSLDEAAEAVAVIEALRSGAPGGEWAQQVQVGPAPGLEFGGFWLRVAAYIFDVILLGIIGVILSSALGAAGQAMGALIFIAYFIGLWGTTGQTIGMMLLGLHVVRNLDGGKITWGNAVLRFVGLFVAFACLYIGVIWVAFDSRKQGWHDRIGGTVVIRSVG
ncbi:MAG TPA: RDD family protein, partial [Candidatus Limnocylindrales bacterium]